MVARLKLKGTGQLVKKRLLFQSINLIAGQSDSKVYHFPVKEMTVKKKRELFPGPSTTLENPVA